MLQLQFCPILKIQVSVSSHLQQSRQKSYKKRKKPAFWLCGYNQAVLPIKSLHMPLKTGLMQQSEVTKMGL